MRLACSIVAVVLLLAGVDGAALGQATGTPAPPPPATSTPPKPTPTATAAPSATAPKVNSASATPVSETPPAAAMLESKPPVYFAPDKHGHLQPIVGFTLEEFEQMLIRRDGDAAQYKRPDFGFESIAATGRADDRYARIDLKFSVAVDATGWVRVPLDLRNSVLEQQAVYRGPGKYALQFDAERQEYAVWLQGNGEQTHELTLKTVTTLENAAGQKRLRLNLPRAVTATLSLSVVESRAAAQVSLGAVLDGVDAENKGSRIRVSGVGGEFQLTWGGADTTVRRRQVLLEAKADVTATIDGRNIAYQADLTVNSFGGEFDGFTVRLPPSSVLVEEDLADLTITKLTPSDKNDPTESYDVRRTAGSTKSLIVRLQALRSLEKSRGGQQMFDFGMFEVTEAVRQSGYLAVEVDGDWQLLWGERSRVRQVDSKPEFLRGRTPTSLFEYYGRPFLLQARIVPRETRVSLDPEYVIDISPGRAFLEVKLKYRVGGAKIDALSIDMLDWQVDEVGPEEIVASENVVPGQSRPLTIPLQQESTGDFEITIRAHRELSTHSEMPRQVLRALVSPLNFLGGGRHGSKTTNVALRLPRPAAQVIGPASLIVRAAENVELSPRDSLHAGLVRSKQGDAQSLDGEVWTYTADGVDAVFSADMRPLVRSIQTRAVTTLAPTRTGGEGRQQFIFNVAHEPIDALEFEAPTRLLDKGRPILKVDGQIAPWVVVNEDAGNPKRPARIRVNLPAARIGEFTVGATYHLPEEQPVSQASLALDIPMLAPLDGELLDHELHVVGVEGLTVQHVDDAWQPEDTATIAGANPRDMVYRGASTPTELMLGVRWDDPAPADDLVVERLWIQTLLLGASRQERAVFQLTTRSPTLGLRLPDGATGATIMVDGNRREAAELGTTPSLMLRLPPGGGDRPYVVDVRYRLPGGVGSATAVSPPMLENTKAVQHVYRQIVLPADVCLIDASEGYVAEFDWAWSGPALVRRPLLSQADLEAWSGAAHEAPLPGRINAYVFSGYGDVPQLHVTTVKRTVLVFAASGAVLLYFLGLLYFSWMRQPALIIVSAVVTATLGALFPDVAPIVLQAAAVGAVLSLTALVLDRNVSRRRQRTATLPIESSLNLPRGSTKTRISQAIAVAPPSTASVDLPASAASGSGSAS